ncbi:M23 family metallopeptidase [Streptomyces sp. NPDC059396]|uniref:M23 family metallopeptidase n=1 Tax=Streptomyces sp. NPDC059396 TaxID=3346819 RepID=UPI0036B423E9
MAVRKWASNLWRLCWGVFVALVLVHAFGALPFAYAWIWPPAVVAMALGFAMSRTARAHHAKHRPAAVEVAAPVTGRWLAHNSPADKVPSHGLYRYGQEYAIDVVAVGGGVEGEPGAEGKVRSRPDFAWVWPIARRNRDFPAFGEPVLAVADATVVHASDRQRDHLSRNSLVGLVYLMLIESAVRQIGGAGRMTGNRLVLDLGNGTYAMYAHLRRGSLTVCPGDRVSAGQVLARCGNSGNSTEPHVHFQLMDHPDPDVARGVPFRWEGIGVPGNGAEFVVGRDLADTP